MATTAFAYFEHCLTPIAFGLFDRLRAELKFLAPIGTRDKPYVADGQRQFPASSQHSKQRGDLVGGPSIIYEVNLPQRPVREGSIRREVVVRRSVRNRFRFDYRISHSGDVGSNGCKRLSLAIHIEWILGKVSLILVAERVLTHVDSTQPAIQKTIRRPLFTSLRECLAAATLS